MLIKLCFFIICVLQLIKFQHSDFQISYFLNQQTFSDLEKSEIVNFLESQIDINVTDPLLLYYLNYYLIQNLI